MLRQPGLIGHIILILLAIMSPLCYGEQLTDIDQSATAAELATPADVRIGLTLEQYQAKLKRLEKEIETRFVNAHAYDRQHLETQLHAIQAQLQDTQLSYQNYLADLTKRIEQLEAIRGQVSNELVNQTQQALADDDFQQVEQLLNQMETQTAGDDQATAAIYFQRYQIKKDEIRLRQAYKLCQRAVQLAPERTEYLSELAELAHTLGEYEKAVEYYEQALASYLKAYGEDHPNVAISRNNLGTAWDALGEYKKAIEFYELALANDLKVYGEDHSDVAVSRNNLGMAWLALGEYKKAIVYLEQALASDLKNYGENHPQVATYYNNLAGAWYALGEFKKANDYLKQALTIFEKVLGPNHPDTQRVRAYYQQLLTDIRSQENE